MTSSCLVAVLPRHKKDSLLPNREFEAENWPTSATSRQWTAKRLSNIAPSQRLFVRCSRLNIVDHRHSLSPTESLHLGSSDDWPASRSAYMASKLLLVAVESTFRNGGMSSMLIQTAGADKHKLFKIARLPQSSRFMYTYWPWHDNTGWVYCSVSIRRRSLINANYY